MVQRQGVHCGFFKGPKDDPNSDPDRRSNHSDSKFLDEQSRPSSTSIKEEEDMTSQFDPDTAENNEEIEK